MESEQNNTPSKSELERIARQKSVRWRKIKKILLWFLVLVVCVGAIYGLVLWSKKSQGNKPGLHNPEMESRDHIPVGSPRPNYNSNPPTSGQHYATWADWGVHEEQLVDEYLVHNLEHGGIWISYKDKNDKQLIEQLKSIVDDFTLKVVMTPRPENDSPIAVAAWGRLLKLDKFDEKQIRDFIGAYINRGPEQVPY